MRDTLFAQQREADGEVGGYKCFSFAADGRGKEDQILTGINGGTKVTTGFGHAAILSHADTVVRVLRS